MYQNRFFSLLAVILLSALSISAQTLISSTGATKPQAILFDVYNAPSGEPMARNTRVDSQVRARVVNKSAVSVETARPKLQNFVAPSRKFELKHAVQMPTAMEEEAFELINEQRRLKNLAPLVWDLEMLYVARLHSNNMAELNFFSHAGKDGKTADDRADNAGIKDWRAIGENIAYSRGIKNRVPFAVQSWMNSPTHKDNLLDKRWKRSGIGVAVSSDGKFYITQVFRN